MSKRFYFLLTIVAILALSLAACGGEEAPPAPAPTEEIIEAPEDGEDPEAGEPLEEPASEESALAGEVVSIFGAFVDTDAERFELSMQPFEERTGIDVQYEGSGDFESLIIVRDEGGNPPDIGSFPQPGLMRDFVEKGSLVPLSEETEALVDQNYAPVWKSLASVEGTPYGLFHRVSVKSLVWYPTPEFSEAGYEVPGTWDEMIALSDQIVADGAAPWCIGMESSGATGWVATDWVEDIMLRLHGGEVYDQWVNHDIPFNDPRVQEAVEYMGDVFLNPDYVLGGTDAILTVSFGDSPNGLFEQPPQCYLHRQASFIPVSFPDNVVTGVDTTIFPFPEINPEFGVPALGAGELYAAFNERPATDAVMQYLATGESGEAWARAGGALFPHQDFDLDVYPSDLERAQAELILNAEVFRFDGSDLMPGSVGAGTFWSGMVDYVGGADVETVLQSIEDSWPEDSTRVDEIVEEEAEEEAEESSSEEMEEMDEGSATAASPDLSGEVVTIFGAFVDTDAERFELSMVPFEERTGVDIQYEGSGDFESLIIVRDEGGNPPDIGSFPQPGLMRDFVEKGSIVPLSDEAEALVDQNYAPVWKNLATVDGTPYGVFHRVSVKSLVWYPTPEFEEAGYDIPGTWDEMIALSDQIVADGTAPWCIGMESSGATGWVATDWVEDIMLRLHGGEVYDQWVNHDIPFNDPRVQEAVEYMGDIFLNPDYVLGGTDAILTVSFGDSPNGLFQEPPQCYLHRQASFIPSFFPDDVAVGEDTTIFPFPEINPEFGIPALGAGELYAAFNEREATDAVMQYLATGESGEGWAQAGGALFPHQDFDLDVYPSELERAQAELILNAEVFRFDASDLMPGSVGAGTFWSGMVDYVAGEDAETVLQSIEDSWPEE